MKKLKYLVYPGGFLVGMGLQLGATKVVILGIILSIVAFYYFFKEK